jgi:predicted membrane-bound spermidine synthase
MTVEPKLAKRASWISILCSFVLSAETWVKLAELAGFTGTLHVTGTDVTLRTSWAMVGVVDAYVVGALVLWTFTTNKELARFARKNTYAAALVGVAAQAGYHGWQAIDRNAAVMVVVLSIVVGALPPLFAAVGIHMRSIGLLAARTGIDSDKMTAGLLSLSLIHAAADTQARVTSQLVTLRAELSQRTAELAATEALVSTLTADSREARPVSAPPADTDTPVVAPVTVKRSSAKRQAEALTWLADNAGDSALGVLAQKVSERFGVSLATGYRYARAYRATA